MKKPKQAVLYGLALVTAGCLSRGVLTGWRGEDSQASPGSEEGALRARLVAYHTAVDPKPLSDQVNLGIGWLLGQQQEDGGWSQGEESRHFQRAQAEPHERSNVADTCMAALTLVRAGNTPSAGPHKEPLYAAIGFVLGQVERADDDSMSITDVNGTRVQQKIGQHVDTFLAAQLLGELAGAMKDEAGNARLAAALEKIQAKMAANQDGDGTWKDTGWATTLSSSLASKSQFRALSNGYAAVDLDGQSANFDFTLQANAAALSGVAPSGAAGVELYGDASNFGSLNDQVLANRVRRGELVKAFQDAEGEEKDELGSQIERIDEGEKMRAQVKQRTVARLEDGAFVNGFGSNGGEEFLSYMNISEALVADADDDWERWDAAVTKNLNGVQNEDGSWTGHHCITGRTFCTSAALLVLMADRTPLPEAAFAK